jgi:CheY-like chemotaxis protein
VTDLPPIAVAEDDLDDLYLLTRRIREAGFENPILNFQDAFRAISYFERLLIPGNRNEIPCVLFTDLMLPGPDGFELITWVKAQPALAGMKVVIMSGSEYPGHRCRADALKVDGYAIKFPRAEELKRFLSAAGAHPRNQGSRGSNALAV